MNSQVTFPDQAGQNQEWENELNLSFKTNGTDTDKNLYTVGNFLSNLI